jgi:Domain of unknown function (DUF5916)/Carbohydrate family 9 binding domain-like
MHLRRILLAALVAAAARAEGPPAPEAKELPPEASFVRTVRAARRVGPITLDGKMDEPAWQAAELGDSFTQSQPVEGARPAVETRFRVLWDDEYLYFGVECDDPEPPTHTLTRRDRSIQGDYISFDLDTTLDRRTAYHFQVYSSGTQLDGIHFNDTDFTSDWDGAWESVVATSAKGWSIEVRIPLRLLRIPEHAQQFGFNIYRILSRRQEQDQWRFRPNGRAGDVSRFGLLAGLDGIKPVKALELRPYVGTRFVRNWPAPSSAVPSAALGGCSSVGLTKSNVGELCAGLDLRYNLASDLTLVGTVNPDFGQVEADQRVLNLSTFETFFPEKRPFFLEGLDLFKSPLRTDIGGPYGGDAYQMFYSRRIGRTAPEQSVNAGTLVEGQNLVYQPTSVPVASAAKLSGTVGGASVGMLAALESRLDAEIQQPDGKVDSVRTAEARSTATARVRAPVGDNLIVGASGTAVDPIAADTSLTIERRHAHVGEGDFTLFTDDRSWALTGQAVGSLLTGHTPETLRDGTQVGETSSGYAVSGRLQRQTEYTLFAVNADYLNPTFNVNDLGFMARANLLRSLGYVGLRDPHPGPLWQSAQLIGGGKEVHDSRLGNLLDREVFLEGSLTSNDFWFYDIGATYQAPYVDDRELEDGTPIERQRDAFIYGFISTDSRAPLQLQLSFSEQRSFPRFERQNYLELTANLRPLPQLEGTIDVSYNESAGTWRQIRTATALPETGADPTVLLYPAAAVTMQREYMVAQQQARSLSALVRATYAFTPRLTLQAYAQLFTAGIAYGQAARAVAGPGKPTIRLSELIPAPIADLAPNVNDRQAGLNVNLILRWEWRTGSTLYLVYAHQSTNDVPYQPLSVHGELSALGGAGVLNGDTFLLKVDLLEAIR